MFLSLLRILADCITDHPVICDDLLRHRPHCWGVQRHGRLLRAEKQVGCALGHHVCPLIVGLFLPTYTGRGMLRPTSAVKVISLKIHLNAFFSYTHICTFKSTTEYPVFQI